MSPRARAAESRDSTSNTTGRFTVQLPQELRAKIDALGKEATRGVREAMGIDVELSMAQVVVGVITAQYDVMTERQSAEQMYHSAARRRMLKVRYDVSNLADDLDGAGVDEFVKVLDACVESIDKVLTRDLAATNAAEEAVRCVIECPGQSVFGVLAAQAMDRVLRGGKVAQWDNAAPAVPL